MFVVLAAKGVIPISTLASRRISSDYDEVAVGMASENKASQERILPGSMARARSISSHFRSSTSAGSSISPSNRG
jgi:hypothetical protein